MFSRIIIILALTLAGAKSASACTTVAQSLDEALAAAKIAFVGSVETVDNGLATLKVEKSIKGAKDGDTLDVDVHADKGNCGINFLAGERWLYLGNEQPSGSLQLQDDMGRPNEPNLASLKAKVGDVGAYGSDVVSGTLRASCAPWDGAAFAISLDNGVSASVYVNEGDLDKKDKNSVVSYTTGQQQVGGAQIVQCPRPKDGKPDNLPCRSSEGTISIGFVTPDDATGQIKTTDGEYHSLYVFHVKRLKDRAVCG